MSGKQPPRSIPLGPREAAAKKAVVDSEILRLAKQHEWGGVERTLAEFGKLLENHPEIKTTD